MKSPKSTPDKHQHRIAVDTVRNPAKSFLGGMSEAEAIKILKTKFEYSDAEIKRLLEVKLTESQIKRIKPLLTKLVNEVKQELREATFRGVKVTYSDGSHITTSLNPKVTDAEIKRYFRIGQQVNIGSGDRDKVVKITDVEILPDAEF